MQGEGGILAPPPSYLQQVRELCDRHDLLLILDEVQTGVGRTGTMFAYEQSGVIPDIMTLAKGLGSGVAIGAMLSSERIAAAFSVGTHGTTFCGNALACAAAIAVLRSVLEDGVLQNCVAQGAYLVERLRALQAKHSRIRDVRGLGLLIGAELDGPGAAVVDACRERGLIINCTAEKVLRFSPPLIVLRREVDQAMEILDGVLSL